MNFLRRCIDVVTAYFKNNCFIHAAGLTYFTLLAVIPVLCCILFAAKTCRVDEYARRSINAHIDQLVINLEEGRQDSLKFLEPQDDEDRERKQAAAEEFIGQIRRVSNMLFERIEKLDFGTIGWIGFGLLLWTIVSSLGMVETSFNQIWSIDSPRPWWKRIVLYLFILIVLPFLTTVALSIPVINLFKNVIEATLGATWLTRWAGDGIMWFLDWTLFRQAISVLLLSVFFGFFFWIIPNSRVSGRCAMRGGLVTAFLFFGWLKLCAYAQVGIAKSSVLYGSFAFLPIVLAWLNISWQIVLLGAIIVRTLEKERLQSATATSEPSLQQPDQALEKK